MLFTWVVLAWTTWDKYVIELVCDLYLLSLLLCGWRWTIREHSESRGIRWSMVVCYTEMLRKSDEHAGKCSWNSLQRAAGDSCLQKKKRSEDAHEWAEYNDAEAHLRSSHFHTIAEHEDGKETWSTSTLLLPMLSTKCEAPWQGNASRRVARLGCELSADPCICSPAFPNRILTRVQSVAFIRDRRARGGSSRSIISS